MNEVKNYFNNKLKVIKCDGAKDFKVLFGEFCF